jgi:hypothetical protein
VRRGGRDLRGKRGRIDELAIRARLTFHEPLFGECSTDGIDVVAVATERMSELIAVKWLLTTI